MIIRTFNKKLHPFIVLPTDQCHYQLDRFTKVWKHENYETLSIQMLLTGVWVGLSLRIVSSVATQRDLTQHKILGILHSLRSRYLLLFRRVFHASVVLLKRIFP